MKPCLLCRAENSPYKMTAFDLNKAGMLKLHVEYVFKQEAYITELRRLLEEAGVSPPPFQYRG